MNRILLIYDDYAELTTVEFSLKKVGFDVVAITSEFALQEKILSFNPEIVIAYGRGPKVTTLGVGKRLKEMSRWIGKALLIFPQGVKPNPQDLIRARMDLLLEAPVPTVRLIQILAKITNQDDQVLVEKLIKAAATESAEATTKSLARDKEDDSVFVGGKSSSGESGQYVGGGSGERQKDENTEVSPFKMNTEIERIGSEDDGSKDKALNLKSGDTEAKKNQFVLNPETEISSESAGFDTDQSEIAENNDPFQQMKNELAETPVDPKNEEGFLESNDLTVQDKLDVKPLELPELVDPHFQNELDEARNELPERTKKYFEYTKDLHLNEESSLQRLKVRKEQNLLRKDWDVGDNEELDKLRRNFANAMFKK